MLKASCVANEIVRDGHVMLPARVAGIGFGQALSDVEGVAIPFQRLFEIALRREDAAHFDVKIREVPLPARVTLVELDQPLDDVEPTAICRKRTG